MTLLDWLSPPSQHPTQPNMQIVYLALAVCPVEMNPKHPGVSIHHVRREASPAGASSDLRELAACHFG